MFGGDFQRVGRNWDARTLADMIIQSDAFPAILRSESRDLGGSEKSEVSSSSSAAAPQNSNVDSYFRGLFRS
jgi:hypothetical protein